MKTAKIVRFHPNGKGNSGLRSGYGFHAKLKDKDEIYNWFRQNNGVMQENLPTGYQHGNDYNLNMDKGRDEITGYIAAGPLMVKFFMHFRFKGV